MSGDLSLLALGVDPATLGKEDPFVGRQLITSGSYVTTHAGEIIQSVVTDDVIWLSFIFDFSHSTDSPKIREAFQRGYKLMLAERLAKSAARKKLQIQRIHFGSTIQEVHSFTPLVVIDPQTKSTDLNVPLLPDVFLYLGSTATVDALEKVLADQRAMERVSHADIEDIVAEHIVILFTDGRLNISNALKDAMAASTTSWTPQKRTEFVQSQVADVRNFIRIRNEKWAILAFCTAEPAVAETFYNAMRRSPIGAKFTALIQKRLEDRLTVISQMSPENQPKVAPTLLSEAAQLMYEAMMAGWSYFVTNESDIAAIPDEDDRILAQLYQAADEVIVQNIESGYFALGGLAMKPSNILTSFHNPDAIYELVGTHMSSSIVRQAGGSQTAIAVNLTPTQAAAETDASVF